MRLIDETLPQQPLATATPSPSLPPSLLPYHAPGLPFRLISLPSSYQSVYQYCTTTPCRSCGQVSNMPGLCLVCGYEGGEEITENIFLNFFIYVVFFVGLWMCSLPWNTVLSWWCRSWWGVCAQRNVQCCYSLPRCKVNSCITASWWEVFILAPSPLSPPPPSSLLNLTLRHAFWGSPYLDEHGEEDSHLRRGKPLYLNPSRYPLLAPST